MARIGRRMPIPPVDLPTPPKVTAVKFDSVGTASYMSSGAGNISWTHNISPNATALFVAVSSVTSHSTWGATCGGKTMTYLPAPTLGSGVQVGVSPNEYAYAGKVSNKYAGIDIFYLMNPPTGLQTISYGTNNTNIVHANSISYLNCSGFGNGSVNPGFLGNTQTSTASISATAPVGQVILNVMAYWLDTPSTTNFTSYTQTARYSPVIGSGMGEPILIGEAPGTGSSTTFSANLTNIYSSGGWGAFALPLYPLVLPEPKVPTTQVVVSRAAHVQRLAGGLRPPR